MIRSRDIPRAALNVTLFWMGVLLFLQYDQITWARLAGREILVFAGIAAGALGAAVRIYGIRQGKLFDLAGRVVRGMDCSISSIPIHRLPLAKSNELPDIRKFIPPEARADKSDEFLDLWRQKWTPTHPAYVRLMDALVATFGAPGAIKLPATHATDPRHNHGGRNLMMHSLMVSWLMWREAPRWVYKPATVSGKPIPLKDPDYQFSSADPLIAILGFAHDIGKIECFIPDKDGTIIECKKNHDLVGAQILARMDEYWDPAITVEDREILQLVIAHYHHPSEMPFDADGNVISDRLHALLELLIKCDRLASAMENGSNINDAMATAEAMAIFDENEEGQMDLWTGILETLGRADRINSINPRSNIGWYYQMPHYNNKKLVVLKEDDFVKQVAQLTSNTARLDEKTGGKNPVMVLTREILMLLGKKGALFTDHESTPRAPESSLFKVTFFDEKQYFGKDKIPKTVVADESVDPRTDIALSAGKTFGSCILIDAEANEEIWNALSNAVVKNYRSVPHIGNARMGGQGIKSRSDARAEAKAVSITSLALAQADEGRGSISDAPADPHEAEAEVLSVVSPSAETGVDPDGVYDAFSTAVQENTDPNHFFRQGARVLIKAPKQILAQAGFKDISLSFFKERTPDWHSRAGIASFSVNDQGNLSLVFLLRPEDAQEVPREASDSPKETRDEPGEPLDSDDSAL